MIRKAAAWKTAAVVTGAVMLFASGMVVGQNKFNKPKSIIHLVTIQWTPEATPEQRQAVLDGLDKMAGEIPGIKNVWTKSIRVQPREFNAAFAIEFEDQAAADRYAKHPAHEAWNKVYLPVRAESRSQQVTN